MLRIRLRRTGKKFQPYYRVVVAEQLGRRDGRFLETLGSYDPHSNPPAANLNEESTREWLRKGAQPSEAAEKLLRRAGIITTPAPVRKQVEKAPAPAPVAKAEAAPAAAAVAEEAPAAEAPAEEAPAAEAAAENEEA
jgi:small subunit ribosomal protein S16